MSMALKFCDDIMCSGSEKGLALAQQRLGQYVFLPTQKWAEHLNSVAEEGP